jgi:RNA polymerase sigma-70 factor, ECF subfamily
MERPMTLAAIAQDKDDTRDALVRRAQRGDLAAFDELLAGHLDRSFRFACTVLGSEADARDAVQDAYIAVWRQLPRLREPARFGSWLGQIVLNECRQTLRRRGRVREISLTGMPAEVTPDRASGAGHAGVDDRDALQRALNRLTLDQRAILALHHLEEHPVSEIAARLGVPIGTAKWRLYAARRALEHALTREDV